MASFLNQFDDRHRRTLYVCVRSYHGWMSATLERLGFEPCNDQAVMVKRLAARVRRPSLAPLPALDGTHPEPTTPFAHVESPKLAAPAGESI
jgi:hypothetical protein